jgi:two-component system, response regulator
LDNSTILKDMDLFSTEPASPTKMLVVEDNIDDSFLLTRQLARAHIDDCITVIGDGEDALSFLLHAATLPLAVFLDLRLPGLSGIQLLRAIRQEPRLRAIPVIVMTASVDPKDVEECTRLGVTAYLPKPVGVTTFIKIVAHLLPRVTAHESS